MNYTCMPAQCENFTTPDRGEVRVPPSVAEKEYVEPLPTFIHLLTLYGLGKLTCFVRYIYIC